MEADILYDILSGRGHYVNPQTPPPVDVDKIFKLSSQYPLGSLIGMPKYPQQHPRKSQTFFGVIISETPRVNILSPRGSVSSNVRIIL